MDLRLVPSLRPPGQRTLRSRLVTLALVTAVPLVAFAALLVALLERGNHADFEQRLQHTTRALALAVDGELEGTISTLQALSASSDLDNADLDAFYDECRRVLETQRPRGWLTVALSGPDGLQLLSTKRPFGETLPPVSGVESFTRLVATRRPVVGDFMVGRLTRQPSIVVRVPVLRGGALKYALTAVVSTGALTRLLEAQQLPARWLATVLDTRGIVVARTLDPERMVGRPEAAGLRETGASDGVVKTVTAEGLAVYGGSMTSRLTGWTIAVGAPAAEVEASWRSSFWLVGGGGLVLVAGALLLAGLYARRLAAPIAHLAATADSIVAGHVPPPSVFAQVREVAALQQSLRDAALRRERQRELLHTIVDHIPVMIAMTDPRTRGVRLNKEFERAVGWSTEDARRVDLMEACCPDPESRASVLASMRSEAEGWRDVRLRTRDGRTIETSWSSVRLEDQTRIAIGIEIGERKRAEEALRRSERLYRGIGESIDFGIWVCDPEGRCVHMSESFLRLVGLTQEQCADFGWGRVLHPGEADATIAAWKECVRTGAFWEREHRVRGVDGEWHHVLARGVPIRDEEGRVTCWAGINLDVGRLETTGRALRESQERLALALDISGLGTWEWNLRTGALKGSARYFRLLGYEVPPDGGVIAESQWKERVHPEDLKRMARVREQARRDRTPYQVQYRAVGAGDGRTTWIEVLGRFIGDEAGEGVRLLGVARDITDDKRRDEDRRRLLEREQAARIDAEQALERLHRLQQDERQARLEAEAANRTKDEFLAMLGHELRNPLGAIATAVRVLDRVDTTAEVAARAREIIDRQTRHLARLVDDLLDVGRVTTGKIVLQCRPASLATCLTRCLATLASSGTTGRHRVETDLHDVWAEVDETRVEQVFGNLLVNAVKYTPAGGTIAVTLQREGGEAVVRVRDSGVGIAPELLPRVFDLFVQGDRSLERAQGGLGIGLTLVRRLIELHGGHVEAASEGSGGGSIFTVRLPAVEARPAPGLEPRADTAGARTVLLIEDNDDAREMLRELLSLAGYAVHEARDGLSGVDAALRVRPDVVLVDVGLPGFDGYEVVRRIRAACGGARPVLVALTGYGLPEDRRRARDAGFDEHLTKPVDEGQLTAVLSRVAS